MNETVRINISRFLSVSGDSSSVTGHNLLDNNIHLFSIFMTEYKENDDIIESPVYSLKSNRKVIPLWAAGTTERKTFGTILRDLNAAWNTGGLSKVKDKEGNVYYGMKGLILNSNFEPLVLLTIKHSEGVSTVRERVLRVSPKVFNNVTVVDKGIIKYLMPYCASCNNYTAITIIIDNNIDKFIRHPNIPKSINTNEEIQQLLINNVDNLCL